MRLPPEIIAAVRAHARWAYPEEACGLIAADASGEPRMAYCLTNTVGSDRRFTIDPTEHFHALRHAERQGWHLAGSFHSHPASEAVPSSLDIEGALDPEWVYLIAGPVGEEIPVRVFRIRDGEVDEMAAGVPA